MGKRILLGLSILLMAGGFIILVYRSTLGVLAVLTGLGLLVYWHAVSYSWQCSKCNDIFNITVLTDFISPHGFGKKYVKCPKCQKRVWAYEIKRMETV